MCPSCLLAIVVAVATSGGIVALTSSVRGIVKAKRSVREDDLHEVKKVENGDINDGGTNNTDAQNGDA